MYKQEVVHYAMEYVTQPYKEWNPAICDNTEDLEGMMLSEVSQRKMNITWFHLYMQLFKKSKWTNKTKQIHRNKEQNDSCQKGESGMGKKSEREYINNSVINVRWQMVPRLRVVTTS